jgi:hypothetical protein
MAELALTVDQMRQRDVGRNFARIDGTLFKALNIKEGDPILLSGGRKTVAIAMAHLLKPTRKEKNKVQIDGFTRKNAGVGVGDKVKISAVNVHNADAIVIAPVDMRLNVDDDFTNFVRNRLEGRFVCQGDEILVMMLGHAIPFTLVRGSPHSDALCINSDTKVSILNDPVEMSGKEDLAQKLTGDFRMLLRHEWLKVVSSRLSVSNVTFSIAGTGITEDSEERVLEQAKKIVDDTLRPVDIVINFYSENDENIGTLPWLRSDVLGNVSASYPDIQIPPALRYQPVSTDVRFSTSRMRRCFKTGLKECPKEIKFSPKMVFVAMPFRPDFQDLYKYAIRPALEDVGFEIWKADEKISNIDVMCKICHGIQECSYVLANISDWNPNVLFEMGLAYGLGKNVVLIKDRKRNVPVDLKGLEYVDYENIDDLRRNITAFFRSVGKSLKCS